MEEILIPMECLYDIPSLNQMSMPSYKAGDIFMFNPFHEVHVELQEHDVFKEIDNNLCEFICQISDLNMGTNIYQVGQKIADEDIKIADENVISNLCYVGYIQKIYIGDKKPNKEPNKKIPQKPKKKSSSQETYTMLAKQVGKSSSDFKKLCFELLGINIPDMRKKAPSKIKKQIIKALGNQE